MTEMYPRTPWKLVADSYNPRTTLCKPLVQPIKPSLFPKRDALQAQDVLRRTREAFVTQNCLRWQRCQRNSQKAKVKFSLSTPLRYIGEAKLHLHAFLTSALGRGDWSAARQFSPRGNNPRNLSIGGWIGFRARVNNWDMREISCHCLVPNPVSFIQ